MITWGWAVAAMLFGAYAMSIVYSVRDKKRILELEGCLSLLLHCFESQRYFLDLRDDPKFKEWMTTDLEERIIYAQNLNYGLARKLLGARHEPYVEDIAKGRDFPMFMSMRASQEALEKEIKFK